ncbi:centrosomal protein of 112 kDa [Labeo rohita]|uniref:Centrosomal protein of 112 kDa n=1 Tax=Labeo rohita TaxID=84645 RepID=A0A498NB08_LABRO|nr:centrosomal protein of 112 kDa [Labeo rohita]
MLVKWNISKSRVHVILHDNASNMKKAMDEMGVSSLGCFAHSLQLVVHEGLLSQRSVSDALANCRKIIGHFKHSPLATTRLEDIQKDLKMPTKRLQQDVATRWNSTFYMVESLLEQKRTISAYGADHDLPATLTANQWALLEKAVTVLAPFEEVTKQISSSTSSVAEVIPSVTVLKRLLARESQEDTGIKTMKTTLLEAVKKRFATIEEEPLYAVATLLDPHFKDRCIKSVTKLKAALKEVIYLLHVFMVFIIVSFRYFSSADNIKHAKDALTVEMEKTEKSTTVAETIAENPKKTPRMEVQVGGSSSRESSLKGLFEEILQEHDEEHGAGYLMYLIPLSVEVLEQHAQFAGDHSNMTDQDCFGILDSEFDHYLVDMKPYVLKLTDKTERQSCALWIKKLCDPVTCGSGLAGRKNRNMYARLLLHMLRKGVLEGPFTHKPEAGSLKTLPTYMSIYFDEPLLGRSQEQRSAVLPDWVSGELGQTDASWSTSPLSNTHRKRNLFGDKSPTRPLSSSPVKRDVKDDGKMAEAHRRPPISSDDSDFEARFNSWNLGIENPRYLRENPIPLSPIYNKSSLGKSSTLYDEAAPVKADKEIELRTKVLEAKHQEDTLRMQQKHDAEIQKILDRKNGEIDELKSMYRGKQKEAEETIRRLEKRVQSLLRESQVIRQTKEKQISELKKMSDQSAESLKNEWEKKLHAVVAEMEQEKFELQKKHTDNIQELLEDTNQRLAKMEAEYSSQTHATEQMLHELETRVKQLSVEVENGNLLRQKVTQEKAELEIHIASISAELQEANHRNISQQREIEQMREQHEEALQKLQARHNADMSHFQQEHALSTDKASSLTSPHTLHSPYTCFAHFNSL